MAGDAALALLRDMRSDFAGKFAPKCLKIKTKEGGLAAFVPNTAQRYILGKLLEQKAKTGKIRALILKARQQGCSTLIEGLFYHEVTGRFGLRADILTHEEKATNNLFDMTNRFHEHCPLKPHVGKSNAKELYFDRLASRFAVNTARTKGTGRSATIQLFHGSEVAFWPNAEEHMGGIKQAVPDAPGTIIVLESTANGIGNMFHKMWQEAVRGESEYIAIFTPWFWSPEYREPVPAGFELTTEEEEYATTYGLDLEQMAWRRKKIRDDFQGEVWRFRQEYPATPEEAFQTPTKDPFIRPEIVVRARKFHLEEDTSKPLIMAADPSWTGDDSTSVTWRRGRKQIRKIRWKKLNTMETAGRLARLYDDTQPDAFFIDLIGIGAGIHDRLLELNIPVIGINVGDEATDPERWFNKRAEIWDLMREALEDPGGFDLLDDDQQQADLCAPTYERDSSYRLRIESKEKMKKRGLASPDDGDSLALTYAQPVVPKQRSVDPGRPANWRTM